MNINELKIIYRVIEENEEGLRSLAGEEMNFEQRKVGRIQRKEFLV